MVTLSAALGSSQGINMTSAAMCKPARPTTTAASRLSRRRVLAPPTAVDPTLLAASTREFGLTLIGVGAVTALAAAASSRTQQRSIMTEGGAVAATVPTAVAPVAAATSAAAPNAELLVKDVVGAAPEATVEAAAAAVMAIAAAPAFAAGNGKVASADIQAELRQYTEAAVAAVKSAAEAEPARAAAVATLEPNGSAVKPGMTVQEATQQVQDWISAWRADGDNGTAEDTVAAPASATAFQEPATADAPLSKPAATATANAVAERSSRPASQAATAQAAPAEKGGENLTNYQAKIEGLWASFEQKRAKEAQLLARSDKILEKLAAAESAEQAQVEVAVAEQPASRTSLTQQQNVFAALLARMLAFFAGIQHYIQQLVSKLGGGRGSGGAAAGASA